MNAVFSIDHVRDLAHGLEDREQARHGGSRDDARQRLARRLGVSPGTLYNLARDRLKKIDEDVRRRLTAYAVRELEQEIARLNRELEMARRMGGPIAPALVAEIASVLDRAQALYDQAAAAGFAPGPEGV